MLETGLSAIALQVVSTDHCPFCFKQQKELGLDNFTKIPNGGPGVEHRIQPDLFWWGREHSEGREWSWSQQDSGKAVRTLSAQRDDCGGKRC